MNLQQDVFIEKIVKRRKSGKDYLTISALVSLYLLLIFVAILFLQYTAPFLIFIIIGGAYGLYYLITNLDLEYEYICTNGHLDIDAIIHKRKRRRKISMKAQSMEILAPIHSDDYKIYARQADSKKLDLTTNTDDKNVWFFVGNYKEGRYLVTFEPDERILKDIKRYNPSKVQYNIIQGR